MGNEQSTALTPEKLQSKQDEGFAKAREMVESRKRQKAAERAAQEEAKCEAEEQAKCKAEEEEIKAKRKAEKQRLPDTQNGTTAHIADKAPTQAAAAEALPVTSNQRTKDNAQATSRQNGNETEKVAQMRDIARRDGAAKAETAKRKQANGDQARSKPPAMPNPTNGAKQQTARRKPETLPVQQALRTEPAAWTSSRKDSGASKDGRRNPLDDWDPRKEPLPRLQTRESEENARPKDPISAGVIRTSSTAFEDDRRGSNGRITKRPKNSVSTSQSPTSPSAEQGERNPPQWYMDLKPQNTRRSGDGGADILLDAIKTYIRKAQELHKKGDNDNVQKSIREVRERLHRIAFIKVDGQLLRNKRILDNKNGLPQIFDSNFDEGVPWPYDVKADAEELYLKWYRQDFDIDILRGIIARKPGQQGGDRVKPESKKNARRFGSNGIVNGQWWPALICAYRDGAHGETMGGVSGKVGEGAYSCFMSGGGDNPYPDRDHGEIVEYCGTDDETKSSKITTHTQMLLDGHANGEPVRFIRGHKAKKHSGWAPEDGFRYDGLYDITDYEVLDRLLQRYRFNLVRRPGQGQIRGGKGPESRPTKEELDAYKKDKRCTGFNV